MRTTKKERLSIGEQIYTHVLTISQAADKHNINPYTARSYMREYRDFNNLPPMNEGREEFRILNDLKRSKYEDLQEMDKEALIDEISKDKSINILTYFKYPKKEKINYKLRNEILSKVDESDLNYSSKNIDEVLDNFLS